MDPSAISVCNSLDDPLSLEQLRQIDLICQAFETAWQKSSSSPPSLETFLTDDPAELTQQALFRELLKIDVSYRRAQKSGLSVRDYCSQFPRMTAVIQLVFAELKAGGTDVNDCSTRSTQEPKRAATSTVASLLPTTPALGVTTFANYELLEIIAQGGMGVVYKARQHGLNRIVALKLTLAGKFASAEARRRFQSEAIAAGKLDHPNIVPIFDVGESQGQLYYSMGYVDGESLKQRLSEGPLSPAIAAEIVESIADAVQYAHEQGVVHRDLKPGNVLIDRQGQPRIADFGLAKTASVDSSLTATGQILGTPSFMPPEQARGDVMSVGPSADVYSMGATLYCLLTGRPPFQAASVMETLQQVLTQDPVSPRALNPRIPQDLETICLKCLHKEREHRYGSASALATEIGRFRQGLPILARPISSVERFGRWARRHRTLAAALVTTIAALVLMAGLGFAFAAYQSYASGEILRTAQQLKRANQDISDQQSKTVKALETVTTERNLSNALKTKADEQAALAESRRQEEERQRTNADKNLEIARNNEYVATIRLAEAKWKAGDVAGMNAALDALRPSHGKKDLRNWDWNYLWNLSHSELLTIPLGSQPENAAISSNGCFVITSSNQLVTELWDVLGETRRLTYPEEADWRQRPHRACFNSDGSRIALASRADVSIRDAVTGNVLHRFEDPGRETVGGKVAHALAFSPDGLTIAKGCADDRSIRAWRVDTKERLWTIETAAIVIDIAFSPDNRIIASANFDRSTSQNFGFLWDAVTGKQLRAIATKSASKGVCFLNHGQQVAFAGDSVEVFDVASGSLSTKFTPLAGEEADFLIHCRSTPDPNSLLIYSKSQLWIWSPATGERRSLKGHIDDIVAADVDADGRFVTSVSRDGTIRRWDFLTGIAPLPFEPALSERYRGQKWVSQRIMPHFSMDGTLVYRPGSEGAVWDVASGQLVKKISPPASSQFIGQFQVFGEIQSFRRDGSQVVGHLPSLPTTTDEKGRTNTLYVWDLKSRACCATVSGGPLDGYRMPRHVSFDGFSPCGKYAAATYDLESGIPIWNTSDWSERIRLTGPGDALAVAFNADSTRLAVGHQNYEVTYWDLTTGKQLHQWKTHAGRVYSVALSSDGSRLASASGMLSSGGPGDNTIRVFDCLSGSEQLVIRGHRSEVLSVRFSRDGKRIYSASSNGGVRIWNADTGQELLQLEGSAPLFSLSPDGTRIVGGGNIAGEIAIWDGRPESEYKTRAIERTARATVAFFRNKATSPQELVDAIQADRLITEPARKMAIEFAKIPSPELIQLESP